MFILVFILEAVNSGLARPSRLLAPDFGQVFDQSSDQGFDQGFDQGLQELHDLQDL